MAKPIKFNDVAHDKLRKKVRRFREKHAAKLSDELERRKLMRFRLNGGDKYPKVFMYESVDQFGHAIDVIVSSESEPPAGAMRSPFLPSFAIGKRTANALRDARLKQIAEWRGNTA